MDRLLKEHESNIEIDSLYLQTFHESSIEKA